MSRLFKILALAVAGIVLLIVLSAAALLLFFDPNNYRDEIATRAEAATGRSLTIEGDLSVSVFPWLAVEMGKTRLGNAAGFGDEPFVTFDSARLSVRLMPLLLRREIAVGTASLESLRVNLAVNAQGTTNWQDLTEGEAASGSTQSDDTGSDLAGLDIAGVEIRDAEIRYRDQQAGTEYILSNVDLETGRIGLGEAFDVSANFAFNAKPDEISGELQVSARANIAQDFSTLVLDDFVANGKVNGIAARSTDIGLAASSLHVDVDNSRLEPTSLVLTALGLTVDADVRALSWADDLEADAAIKVAQFSLRELLTLLDIDPPETADPNALQKLAFSADAMLDANSLSLRKMNMQLDDTTMTGELSLPVGTDAPIRFDLSADRMDVDRYMAPASDADTGSAAANDDFEIPVDMIRGLNARGTLRLAEANLSGIRFTNLQLGLNVADGKLRLNPLAAELFDGSYSGDVRIDASGDTPALSLNEQLTGVSLTPLAQAMFERDNITGTIGGQFVLAARGKTLSTMRENLNGNMSFELADGAWQGVDLWHQLRAARAIFKQEQPPAAKMPAQTEFTSVKATGTVTNGIFTNNDLMAEMPFLQLTGNGTVNLVKGELDYSLQARVLERPEFIRGASEAELAEFTEALIPVRIRGPLADPSVRPDIEAMFRKEVEDSLKKKGDELRDRLLDRLSKDKDAPAAGEVTEGETDEGAAAEEAKSPEDQLKDKLLKKLFDN